MQTQQNTYRKLANGDWAICAAAQIEPGSVVPVALRSGATKQVKVGALIYAVGDHYVHEIAPVERPAAQSVGDLGGILAMFDRAKTHLRHPAVLLGVPNESTTMRITVAGPRASVPGSLSITSDERDRDGKRQWFGRVRQNGTFEPSRDGASPNIAEQLRRFAADPATVAAEHGRLTGRCCFCNIALRDERSTAVGYGPTCADHYGLPWGH